MKLIALGIAAGGAAAAAVMAAGIANAAPGSDTAPPAPHWTPTYTTDDAQIVQGAGSFADTWRLPASFTDGQQTLTGTDYLTQSPGGFNNEFITNTAVYDQDQLGGGLTNIYYATDGGKTVVDFLKTPFGRIDMSSMAWLFKPADVSNLTPASALPALENAGLYSALNQGEGLAAGTKWTPDYGNVNDAQILQSTNPFAETWKLSDVSFSHDGTPLTGTDYVTQSIFGGGINDEFVSGKDIFDQNQMGLGFTNLYTDVGGHITDTMKTPLGNIDLSWLSWLYTPTDFTDAQPVASAIADAGNAGLYSALDLGAMAP